MLKPLKLITAYVKPQWYSFKCFVLVARDVEEAKQMLLLRRNELKFEIDDELDWFPETLDGDWSPWRWRVRDLVPGLMTFTEGEDV
jgi:hypothetical protein